MKALKTRSPSRASILLDIGASAMIVALSAGPAFGQNTTSSSDAASSKSSQPNSATDQDILVTGVRASVGSALQLQRNATSLQQSIVAEDIGKLPDNNVVEALQHVTGVSIIRDSAEPSVVLIRGLPDIATTLSGRQIFTSSSRSISLPDFPAELLARVDVKKAPEASDIEGGIAGVINVELHRPLDFSGLEVAGSIKGSYGSLNKKVSPQGSLLVSNRWETGIGDIGILVNAAYSDRTTRQDRIQNQNQPWRQFRPAADAGSGPATGVPAGQVAYPGTVLLGQNNAEVKRTTINSSLQWQSSSGAVEAHLDYFYAGLDTFSGGDVNVILMNTCPNLSPSANKAFPGTNIGQVLPSGCYGLTSMQAVKSKEDTHQFAAGLNWEASDRLTVKAQGNYTKSKDRSDRAIVDAQYNYGPEGVIVTVNPDGDGGYFVNQPGNPQASPNTYLDQWYDFVVPRKGHEYSGRLDLNYEVSDTSFLRSIDVGYRYNSRQATADQSGTGLNCAVTNGLGLNGGSDPYNKYRQLAANSEACTAYRAESTPQPYRGQGAITSVGGISYGDLGADAYHSTKGSFFGGRYGTASWVNLDQAWIFDNLEKVRNLFGYSGPQDFTPSQHFDVKETSNALYLKTNYGIDFKNGMALDGNFGLRMIRTTLEEGGFSSRYVPLNPNLPSNQGANATCTTCLVYTRTDGKVTDTQWLPSFNARLELLQGLFARVAWSKTVTRPTFAQLNPGETVNSPTATIRGSITSGNPALSPVKSTNYDFDLTYYWGGVNHIGASIFYREVAGYIQTQTTVVQVNGEDYNLNRPENFQDATIKGIEAGYSQFLDFLPGFFSGFGFDVNATYIDAPFNNVPKFHANLTGIYEKGPLSLRVSYTYNSPYLVGNFTGGVQPQQRWASVRENMDISANYRVNDNLTVSFDVANLLDNYQRQSAGKGAENERLYAADLSRFDTVYSLGVRFKL